MTDEELAVELNRKKTHGGESEKCTVAFRRGRRDLDRNHAVVEIGGGAFRRWIKDSRVFVGLDSCRVEEFLQITRCYRCYGFGHVSAKCRVPQEVCGHCAKEGHTYKDCGKKKEEKSECINCKKRGTGNRGHEAMDPGCPEYHKATEVLKARTNYA